MSLGLATTACARFGSADAEAEAGAGAGGDATVVFAADASAESAAVHTSFCKRERAGAPPVFCADFESSVAAAELFGFDTVDASKMGRLDVVDAPERSGSRALRARLDPSDGSRSLALSQLLGGAPEDGARWSLGFDFRIEKLDLDYAALGSLNVTDSEYGFFSGAAAYRAGQELSCMAPSGALRRLPLRQWRHVDVTIDAAGGELESEVRVDGEVVQSKRTARPAPSAALRAKVGVFWTSSNTGAAEVYFDDVIVRTRTR